MVTNRLGCSGVIVNIRCNRSKNASIEAHSGGILMNNLPPHHQLGFHTLHSVYYDSET